MVIPADTYQQQISIYREQISRAQRRLAGLGWLRLCCFAAAVFAGYWYLRSGFNAGLLAPVFLFLGGFVYCLAAYQRNQDRLTLLKALLQLNEKEWALATGGEAQFGNGAAFADEQHPFSGDLDVFGHASLYQHMNRTGTLMGARQLAVFLQSPLQQAGEVKEWQQVMQELAPRLQFRQLFAAQAGLAGETPDDRASLQAWLQLPLEFLNRKWLRALSWLSPALLGAAVVYGLVTNNYYPILFFLCLNWLLLLRVVKQVNRQHQLISNKEKIFHKFNALLQLVRSEQFGDAALLRQQQAVAGSAGAALQQLARISGALDQRMNLLVGVFVNSFVLYDLHCMAALEKWKSAHRHNVATWLDVIARMEAWCSMATFAYNHPGYTYPQVQQQPILLQARELGHPLIPEGECVKNDISIGDPQQFLIITGSNMSGKSTFLRSVGSNLLLAHCGMPVCAAAFSCSPMRIMTSMRIKDSIARHTSYFQAELLRLQQIVQELKSGVQVFILLDEILKGTNSEDKLSGSRRLVEHFLRYRCLGMIATHDLELGALETAYPGKIRNHCFESTISANQLFFDYRIREGIARNKNATFLMQQMHII